MISQWVLPASILSCIFRIWGALSKEQRRRKFEGALRISFLCFRSGEEIVDSRSLTRQVCSENFARSLSNSRDPHSPEYKADFWYDEICVYSKHQEKLPTEPLARAKLSVLKQKPLLFLSFYC
jgi:hypothetical protein